MTEVVVKACIDCKHFKQGENFYNPHQPQREAQPECGNPKAHSRDLVYGKALVYNERADNRGCGKTGKLWEAK